MTCAAFSVRLVARSFAARRNCLQELKEAKKHGMHRGDKRIRSGAAAVKTDRRYLILVRQFPLRPIRSKRDLERAMKIAGHFATYDGGHAAPWRTGLFGCTDRIHRRLPATASSGHA